MKSNRQYLKNQQTVLSAPDSPCQTVLKFLEIHARQFWFFSAFYLPMSTTTLLKLPTLHRLNLPRNRTQPFKTSAQLGWLTINNHLNPPSNTQYPPTPSPTFTIFGRTGGFANNPQPPTHAILDLALTSKSQDVFRNDQFDDYTERWQQNVWWQWGGHMLTRQIYLLTGSFCLIFRWFVRSFCNAMTLIQEKSGNTRSFCISLPCPGLY